MTSDSKISLNDAITAMERAYERLAVAAELAALDRAEAATRQEAVQQEITGSWEKHTADLETEIAQVRAENEFLKSDNVRLSNQLQQLQKEYVGLQSTATDIVSHLDGTVRQLDLILEH